MKRLLLKIGFFISLTVILASLGSAQNQISTCQELQNIENNPNSDFELTNDIDCSDTENWNGGSGFEPIDSFSGQLDGNSYRISELYINRPTESDVGLFGDSFTGEITDTRFIEADVVGDGFVGVVAGTRDDYDITNVIVLDSNVEGSSSYVGGLAGRPEGSVIDSSVINTDVEMRSSSSYTAGLAARPSSATIQRTRVIGGSVTGEDFTGGLVGRTSGSTSVTDSYSGTEVTGSGSNVGGAIGFTSNVGSDFSQLYSYGQVNGGEGIFGDGGSGGDTVNDAYWDTQASGTTSDGWEGQGLTTSEMTGEDAEDNMVNFDFNNIWDTREGDYPGFQWEFGEPLIYNPFPEDGSTVNELETDVRVNYIGPDGATVTFYQGEPGDGTELREVTVESGDIAESDFPSLSSGESYEWSAQACEDGTCVDAGPWSFDVDTAEWNIEFIRSVNSAVQGEDYTFQALLENVGSTSGETGDFELYHTSGGGREDFGFTSSESLEPGENISVTGTTSFDSAVPHDVVAEAPLNNIEVSEQVIVSSSPTDSDWMNLVSFNLDLTGPDSGIGWDMDDSWDYYDDGTYSPTTVESRDRDPNTDVDRVFFSNIYWQDSYQDYDDGTVDVDEDSLLDVHEPPLCGDDQREYLLEEKGQVQNSEQAVGAFACADGPQYCHFRGTAGPKLYEVGEFEQTDQVGEEFGRFKDNQAVCAQRPGLSDTSMNRNYDPNPQWYSQDYAQEISFSSQGEIQAPSYMNIEDDQQICNENDLYGAVGVRWIGESELVDNPLAYNRGIDDSWNHRMGQMDHPYLISDPEGENWDLGDNMIDNNYSPIPSGTSGLFNGYGTAPSDKSVVADPTSGEYGFCGGDDGSEYLVYQDSNTRHLDTDQSKIGVSSSPNSCILDNSELSNIDEDDMESGAFSGSELQDQRMIYQEGESVSFDSGDTRRSIACFGGQWWGDWPIIFLEDTATVDLGETGFTTFRLINPDDNSKTFDLGINPRGSGDTVDDLDQMVNFESTGTNDMTVTVPAQSSNTYRLEIDANREIDTRPDDNGEDIEVFAQSSDGSLDGEDQVDIEVVDSAADGQGQTRSIPGLTIVQLAVIVAISSLLFFRN